MRWQINYLCERAEEPWMLDLLVATAEIDLDLVNQMREESKSQSQLHPIPSGQSTAVAVAAPSALALDNEIIGPDAIEAMSWSLKTNDQALIRSVCNALPSWCIKEQIHLFNKRDVDAVAKRMPVKAVKLALDPSLLKHRMMLGKRLNAHISETHGDQWSRAPWGSIVTTN